MDLKGIERDKRREKIVDFELTERE